MSQPDPATELTALRTLTAASMSASRSTSANVLKDSLAMASPAASQSRLLVTSETTADFTPLARPTTGELGNVESTVMD